MDGGGKKPSKSAHPTKGCPEGMQSTQQSNHDQPERVQHFRSRPINYASKYKHWNGLFEWSMTMTTQITPASPSFDGCKPVLDDGRVHASWPAIAHAA